MFSTVTPATGLAQNDPMEVPIAAKPTREWKAATVCGRAIGLTREPTIRPAMPPIAIITPPRVKLPGDRFTMVAHIAPKTPTMPNLQPAFAEDMEAKPPMAAIQRRA